jgi:hypothetical protein
MKRPIRYKYKTDKQKESFWETWVMIILLTLIVLLCAVIRIPGTLRHEIDNYNEIVYLEPGTFSVYKDADFARNRWKISVFYEVDGEIVTKVYSQVTIKLDTTIDTPYLELNYDFGEKTMTVGGAFLNTAFNTMGSMGSDVENSTIQGVLWRDAAECRWTTCPVLTVTKTLYVNEIGVLVSDSKVE